MDKLAENKKKIYAIALMSALAVVVILCIFIFIVPSFNQEKVMINDLSPLAGVMMDPEIALASDTSTLSLDIEPGKNCATITIRFKNVENGDKYFVDFTFDEGYSKIISNTLPDGEYKLKLINSGALDKTKALPKTITVGDNKSVVIYFK